MLRVFLSVEKNTKKFFRNTGKIAGEKKTNFPKAISRPA
jgi:hypothetical protein